MQIRLYLDEDAMDGNLVWALRVRGLDVVTALDAGLIQTPDLKHLEYASLHGRTLYSFNISDSMALHASWRRWADSTPGSFSASNSATVWENRCGVSSALSKCDPLRVCAIKLSSSAFGDRGDGSRRDDSETWTLSSVRSPWSRSPDSDV